MEFVDVGKLIRNLNPVNGCTIGCQYCYARRINDRFHITPVWENPQFIEARLKQLTTKKAHTYLMTSMSDFSDWREEWRQVVFARLAENSQHSYLFLTKRPEKITFQTDLQSVWMGVTVTADADKSRIGAMQAHIAAPHYFITFEPLFGPVNDLDLRGIGWVVIGTETGSRKGKIVAKKEWILAIAEKARELQIPVFMKKSLYDIVGEENMRQELPIDFK
ncbi:MAG: DUF5131 family protein [Clostridiales bacterium]|nr:DUF5131 family protein [Clostridiales bacterium]